MTGFAIFLGAMVATILDPISLAGYAVAGLLIRNIWGALAAGAGWAVVVHLIVASMRISHQLGEAPGHVVAARIVGALLITATIFAIARWVRVRRRA